MIHCAKCSYTHNPETALHCVNCGSPLTRRGDTLKDQLPQAAAEARGRFADTLPKDLPRYEHGEAKPTERQTVHTRWAETELPEPPQRGRTIYAGPPPETVTTPSSGPQGKVQAGSSNPDPGAKRKIVGVLITYSWQDSGQIFPVYEGRNLIGRDPALSDICIPHDTTLSSVNTSISYRLPRLQFLIADKDSMSGTDVDSKPVDTEFVPLRNYAKIRTGSTHWTFVSIQPPAGDSVLDG